MASAEASAQPALRTAAAAAQTTGIRLGSGAVLMNHYSPFKVAAMFKQLEAMYPHRIDLGMGRATSGRPSTWPCAAIANHNRWTTMPRKSWKSVMTNDHLLDRKRVVKGNSVSVSVHL